ncbi:hypothetical protein [Brachybacterium squillarum]|uniref:hypothetical protein n=1 Tax=Brachybacterium squillarum TaxID=661979 RepID=UPI00026299AB|nr:hypothetical protein [Brachybacterium squillarum]
MPSLLTRLRAPRPLLLLFLLLGVAPVWALAVTYLVAYDLAYKTLGELTLRNPLVIIALNATAIAGVVVLLVYDGPRALRNLLASLIPRPRDLVWVPILIAAMILYLVGVRAICSLLGIPVPAEPAPGLEKVSIWWGLFLGETGMLAIALGVFGVLLPLLQRITGDRLRAGLGTGLVLGLIVAPGNIFASFDQATAWPLYTVQFCVLGVFSSYLLSAVKGNILFFLLAFWVSASGTAMGMYYFMPLTQLVQIAVFVVFTLVLRAWLGRRTGPGMPPPHTFPEYLESRYTREQGAPIPGRGDRSRTLSGFARGPAPRDAVGTVTPDPGTTP